MDNETDLKQDSKHIPGQKFCYSIMQSNVTKKQKYIFVDKFAKKFIIWQDLLSCGLTKKTFVTSSNMNSNFCWKKWLQKQTLWLFRQHQPSVKFGMT
jgi:hypothetical protein